MASTLTASSVSAPNDSAAILTAPSQTATSPSSPVPDTTPRLTADAPMTLALITVAADLPFFSGHAIRMATVRVRRVISPRVLLVEPPGLMSRNMRYAGRALVILNGPAGDISRGQLIEVIGRPWTRPEAQTRLAAAWPSELDKIKDEDGRGGAFVYTPIVDADVVRTVGGLELASRR